MKALKSLLWLLGVTGYPAPPQTISDIPGTFVPFDRLSTCPQLAPRTHPPASVRDL